MQIVNGLENLDENIEVFGGVNFGGAAITSSDVITKITIFVISRFLELLITKISTYAHISNENFMLNSIIKFKTKIRLRIWQKSRFYEILELI